jgi:transcriptional regulator with XRE-family HTH domain
MLTRYRLMRETIGLSQAEAAERVHGGVAIDSISKWERGRNPAPPGVIRELTELSERLERASQELATRSTRPGTAAASRCGSASRKRRRTPTASPIPRTTR